MERMVSGNELLLVGSIPLDTPEQVFQSFGVPLGRYLSAMPDGEVGPRRHWISRVHYQVLAGHPELEVVQHPAPDHNGVERQHPVSYTHLRAHETGRNLVCHLLLK